MDKTLRELFEAAARDERGALLRHEMNESLADAFRSGGQLLWVGGYILGPDRNNEESPFEFGDDATVGLAVILQIAGELVSGATALLGTGNRYAAAALIRQVVEVEYLAWAFAEDEDEAKAWMRSSKEDRQKFWRPHHLRERAEGRFRGSDYGRHCGYGGHPSPEGISLLPDHSAPESLAPVWSCDLILHGLSVWHYTLVAVDKFGYQDQFADLDSAKVVSDAENRWRENDPLIGQLDTVLTSRPDSGWKPRRRSWIEALHPEDD